ncbi:hypothetical protein M422DRAFT_60332 [Sphaerobolus stellatus SS14]|uniref:CMP/dCMP-type deaminase domain-containing protein n=1 Tax=Sphaerobolus stellatus (strain SS14) TaxID=990650 RepID=A0A0C9UJ78_SPHS4|nr:hypothetical protein M422DRAFT_60332 [Sphaerobolus stellatus SS14]
MAPIRVGTLLGFLPEVVAGIIEPEEEVSASVQDVLADPQTSLNAIPFSTRAHWMRQANIALGAPCPFAAFGSVIVNHTVPGLGELVCTGFNSRSSGNPILHGEIAAIQNCSAILTDPLGPYKLTGSKAIDAFSQLSLYTNAESCPMCASAIRWSSFREYIYGTSIETLVKQGWAQIRVSSLEIFRQSLDVQPQTRLLGQVLTNETDPFFFWQFNPDFPCPEGCKRSESGSTCEAVNA